MPMKPMPTMPIPTICKSSQGTHHTGTTERRFSTTERTKVTEKFRFRDLNRSKTKGTKNVNTDHMSLSTWDLCSMPSPRHWSTAEVSEQQKRVGTTKNRKLHETNPVMGPMAHVGSVSFCADVSERSRGGWLGLARIGNFGEGLRHRYLNLVSSYDEHAGRRATLGTLGRSGRSAACMARVRVR